MPPEPLAMDDLRIESDIARARTLPSWVFTDPRAFELQRGRVFARSWQLVGDKRRLKAPGHVLPDTLLEGCLDEPIVLTRDDDGRVSCLSNVCTHRGAIVAEGEGHVRGLRCRYHGRRFGLDGRFVSMPEFDGVEGFPSPSDDLPRLRTGEWGPFLFASPDPAIPFDEWIGPVRDRTAWMSIDDFRHDASSSRDYHIEANWALYCDNYLEEFHIPYVHGASLTGVLDYESYHTELFRWGNLQLGTARDDDATLPLPEGHPDAEKSLAAYYFWLFPNLMLNFYPWGLSINVVRPLGPARTRVSFTAYVSDEARRGQGAGGDLHRVEMEDEEIVESAQRGVRSRMYDRGRFSPRREVGTHHFHCLLAESMLSGD